MMKKALEQMVSLLTGADDLLVRDGRVTCPLAEHVDSTVDVERCTMCTHLDNIEFDTELCEYRIRCSPRKPNSYAMPSAGR